MTDKWIATQLQREPRPQLPPFFAARVAAHAVGPRHRSWMRMYWVLSIVALLIIFWLAGLPEAAWRILAALLTPTAAIILLLDGARLRLRGEDSAWRL